MHADLGPENIMVSDSGDITSILDWESAGFYPFFWIGTKPVVSPAYLTAPENGQSRQEWRTALVEALCKLGMRPDELTYTKWNALVERI